MADAFSDGGEFLGRVASPRFCVRLFEHLPDVVFCLKDSQRRYRAANPAFARRLGLADPRELLGKTADDFFPPPLAATYREQDLLVLGSGREMCDRLELISNRDGSTGWFLATKVPLHDQAGRVIGLAAISRDLGTPSAEDLALAGVERVVQFIRTHLDRPLRPAGLARLAGLSPTQLERRMHRVFQLSTAAFIRKLRIERAAHRLAATDRPVAEIALDCGYGDQSAFTRQFRATVGLPPAAYRDRSRR
jgi:PAS domain S-box-containing protein